MIMLEIELFLLLLPKTVSKPTFCYRKFGIIHSSNIDKIFFMSDSLEKYLTTYTLSLKK